MPFLIHHGRKLAVAVAAIGFSTAALAQLVANKSEVGPGDTLTITLHSSSMRSDSGYLAVQAAGSFWFVNESGALVPYQPGRITPRRMNGAATGQQPIFSFSVPAGLDLPVTFYSAFGRDSVDLLGTAGAVDMSSLQSVNVTIKPASIAPGAGANGKSLYALHCASCHGANPAAGKYNIAAGKSATLTKHAIQLDIGGMGFLNFLSDSEHAAIADYIKNPN